jgi:uncharacterized protein YkwD
MTRLLPLPLCAALLLAACGDVDDFNGGRRSRGPASRIDSGRQIVITGGSDDGGAPPRVVDPDGGAPLPKPKKDSGAPPPPPPPDSAPPPSPMPDSAPPPGTCGNAFETEVFNLVNQERAKVGMSPLACDPLATQVAHAYSQVMCDKNWLNHTGPDGSSPFSRMQKGGIKFSTGGENIAAGQATPQAVMQSWMNSPGHRANILGNYAHIGVGYVPCGGGSSYGHYWTQNFWK